MAKRADKLPHHNYLRKLRYLMRVGALPYAVGLHQLTVYHDDWYGIYGHIAGYRKRPWPLWPSPLFSAYASHRSPQVSPGSTFFL